MDKVHPLPLMYRLHHGEPAAYLYVGFYTDAVGLNVETEPTRFDSRVIAKAPAGGGQSVALPWPAEVSLVLYPAGTGAQWGRWSEESDSFGPFPGRLLNIVAC